MCNISQYGSNPFDALKGVDKGRALPYRASTTDIPGKRSNPAELYLQLINGTLAQTILVDGGHLNCGAAKSLTHPSRISKNSIKLFFFLAELVSKRFTVPAA